MFCHHNPNSARYHTYTYPQLSYPNSARYHTYTYPQLSHPNSARYHTYTYPQLSHPNSARYHIYTHTHSYHTPGNLNLPSRDFISTHQSIFLSWEIELASYCCCLVACSNCIFCSTNMLTQHSGNHCMP